MAKVDREVPCCTLVLVIGALFCHSLVLYGNLETGSAMSSIGTSTAGWSKVGIGLSRSFRGELDVVMGNITDKLSEAINQTMAAQTYIDIVVSLVGNSTEEAGQKAAVLLQQPDATRTLPDTILDGVNQTMVMVMDKLTDELNLFMQKIKPALIQAGALIIKFGDKIIQVLESFSVSLDKVQKMFDQIMAQLSHSKTADVEEKMVHDTYTLFDVSHTGTISADDLEEVAKLYSISAFQGTKPRDLLKKYDSNRDNQLDKKEFTLMTKDSSIPKSMAVVLRAYAKRLTTVAGNVAAARKRDEVALAVTKYFQLVCAKNRTKLSWVADTLGNGSLPLAFTADIFKNLAMEVDNPDVLTTADVGAVVTQAMMDLHPDHVMKAVDLMATSSFWTSEGFDPKEQPLVLQRVSKWVTDAKKPTGLLMFLEEDYVSEDALNAMPAMAAAVAEENMDRHLSERHRAFAARRAALFATDASQYLLHHLMGGVAATDSNTEAAERSINSGVPAKPETLKFAQYLSWNASATAERFQKQSFAYTSESSSALDSFANQIQGMVKKITGFIKMMEKYSTPAGISRLESQIEGFAQKASADMIKVVNKKLEKVVQEGAPKLQDGIDQTVTKIGEQVGAAAGKALGKPLIDALKVPVEDIVGEALNNTQAGEVIGDMLGDAVAGKLQNVSGNVLGGKVTDFLNDTINDAIVRAGDLVGNTVDTLKGSALITSGSNFETFSETEDLQQGLNGEFDKIATLLRTMVKFLPQATDILKYAKQEVGEAAKVMDTVFQLFEVKGPAIFDNIARLYKVLWTLYFVALLPMTLGLLFYSFWASGYFGGPVAAEASIVDDEGPTTFSDRMRNCCSACNFCMKNFHDMQLCFWSCIILFEVVCLLIFVISLVLCILAGVKTFMLAGCSQVYLLKDGQICFETVKVLRNFQETFYVSDPTRPLEDVCGFNSLLTCDLISSQFKQATMFTTVFSFLAALFSFQMIIESACLHTRARYRRIIDAIKDEDTS